jgi:hypothetical protein
MMSGDVLCQYLSRGPVGIFEKPFLRAFLLTELALPR